MVWQILKTPSHDQTSVNALKIGLNKIRRNGMKKLKGLASIKKGKGLSGMARLKGLADVKKSSKDPMNMKSLGRRGLTKVS
jgi:hypothetical protein